MSRPRLRREEAPKNTENQRDDLLASARCLDEDLGLLGQEFQAPPEPLRRLLGTHSRDQRDPRRWAEQGAIRKELRGRLHEIDPAVAALARGTVRASSLVEKLSAQRKRVLNLAWYRIFARFA